MKALLLLSVLLSGVLAITAAAVEAPEAVKVVEAPEAVEAAPQELQENNQNEDPEVVSAGDVASPEGRSSSCPSGWTRYSDSCYRVVSSSRTWSDAASYCSWQGATLASGQDEFEYNFLQQLTRQAGYSSAWLGGLYFQNRWMWLDNSFFYDWYTPNSPSSCPCIYLRTTADKYNSACGSSRPFICMRKSNSC